nr:cysteine dioxygenase [Rhizobium sp. Q54]
MDTAITTAAEFEMHASIAGLVETSNALVQEYLKSARKTLENLIGRSDLLAAENLISTPGTYTRHLLFGDGNLSIWIMTWSPGSRTSIHDHRCSCCFGIVQGKLTEVRYQAIDKAQVAERERVVRDEGFIDCLLPSGPNIHMMCNESDELVISIHIYGYDHRLHSSSVLQEYTAVADDGRAQATLEDAKTATSTGK